MKNEIDYIVKCKVFLAEHVKENEIRQLLFQYDHGNDIYEHKNSKTNEPNKFVLDISQKLDLKISDKHVALQNLYSYYTLKIFKKNYNNKLKKASTRSNEFELRDGFYSGSDIQNYIEYIIKRYKTLPTNLLIHITSIGLIID